MIDWKKLNANIREVTRAHLRREAIRVAMEPEPWFIRATRQYQTEETLRCDLARWVDDGGRL